MKLDEYNLGATFVHVHVHGFIAFMYLNSFIFDQTGNISAAALTPELRLLNSECRNSLILKRPKTCMTGNETYRG